MTRRMPIARRPVALLLSILTASSGCATTWMIQEEPVTTVIADREPDRARITLLSGEQRELEDPWIHDGNILGVWVRGGYAPATTVIPTDSVASIELEGTPDSDGSGSVWLAVLILPFLIAGAVVAEQVGGIFDPGD